MGNTVPDGKEKLAIKILPFKNQSFRPAVITSFLAKKINKSNFEKYKSESFMLINDWAGSTCLYITEGGENISAVVSFTTDDSKMNEFQKENIINNSPDFNETHTETVFVPRFNGDQGDYEIYLLKTKNEIVNYYLKRVEMALENIDFSTFEDNHDAILKN